LRFPRRHVCICGQPVRQSAAMPDIERKVLGLVAMGRVENGDNAVWT
jgi:hypothetical protein